MLSDKDIDEAAHQLANYRQNDTLTEILNGYEQLLERYKRLRSDYEEERDARERYKQLARGQERNPFILVLVDADGYIFNDSLIRAGADGGTQAAQLLHSNIKASLQKKGLEQCEIMVRLYANVAGLSRALSKAGLIGADKRSLAPFIANFNRSYPLADFIDAGELKENADFKLRGLLRLYAENAQCKHIYFAACHDAGYVSELTQYRNQHDRFTLIRTPGLYFHDEFTKLGLNVEELSGVFRPAGSAMDTIYPKPSQQVANKSVPPATPISVASSKAQSTGGRDVCTLNQLGRCKYGDRCKHTHSSSASTLPVRTSSLSRDWRSDANGTSKQSSSSEATPTKPRDNISKPSSHQVEPKIDFAKLLPKKEDVPAGFIALNKNQQRLDAYIPPPTAEAEHRLKTRSLIRRLCNAKHITGLCNNRNCDYDHRPLDEDLKPALEWLSRSLPCPRRGNCRNARCAFGHVCQKQDCKHRGGRTYCKLSVHLHLNDLSLDHLVIAVNNNGQASGGDFDQESLSSATSVSEDEGDDATSFGGIPVNDM